MDFVVVEPHHSQYPNPISFSSGDRLVISRQSEEFPGWVWVTVPSGNEGWAPESLIRTEEGAAVALEAYTARELDTTVGERVRGSREIADWIWVEKDPGAAGWVPKRTLKVAQ